MNPGIEFKYLWHDTDLLEIRISASNGRFSGRANLYVGHTNLADAAASLAGFPRNAEDVRELKLVEADLRFSCRDLAGHAIVRADIRTDFRTGDNIELVSMVIPIEAAGVDSFVVELQQLSFAKVGVARLPMDVAGLWNPAY